LNDSALESVFSGEVKQHKADQNGDDTLTWKEQHRDASKHEEDTEEIFKNQAHEAHGRMPFVEGMWFSPVMLKVIDWNVNNEQRDDDQGYKEKN
jgi:hypothetical protein